MCHLREPKQSESQKTEDQEGQKKQKLKLREGKCRTDETFSMERIMEFHEETLWEIVQHSRAGQIKGSPSFFLLRFWITISEEMTLSFLQLAHFKFCNINNANRETQKNKLKH